MSTRDGLGRRLEALVARYFDSPLPAAPDLPRYVAPLPGWLEDLGLRLAWPIALINLAGTVFGFWYYGFQPVPLSTPVFTGQFGLTDPAMWVFVPDSPVATLFIALSLIVWKLDLDAEWVHALAFFGCIKLGLWTPYVQLVIEGSGGIATWLYQFLIWSHLAMAVEAFLIYRYSDFPVRAVTIAAVWYTVNDVVDYFVPVIGDPHHTLLIAELTDEGFNHSLPAHDLAAAGAVVLTILAIFLALATRIEKVKRSETETA
jgi:uncharacterized membrane protein YpjA